MTGTVRFTRLTWARLKPLGVHDYESFLKMEPARIADLLNVSVNVVHATKKKIREDEECSKK